MGGTARMIDVHTHLWGDESGLRADPDDLPRLIDMADRFDLEAMVLIPLFGGITPTPEQIEAGNRAAIAAAKVDARFRPLVTVYPPHNKTFSVDEIRRGIEAGACGLKIWVYLADDPCVFPLIETMIEFDRPVLIHALRKAVGQYPLESEPAHIARLAQRYPQAKIIMAHMGGDFVYGCDTIADLPNVWTDPSGTYCETGMLEYAVKTLGARRVLFGSDAPGADFVNNLAKVLAADLVPEDQWRILCENARELWGWT